MSRLNIQNDLFLGRQELDRQSRFFKEDGYLRIFGNIINTFGIANVDSDTNFDNFKVQAGTNAGTFKIGVDSVALDQGMNIIYQSAVDNISITDDSNWYWIKIAYQETSIEQGTVSVTANGGVTGVGTEFISVLRDQNNYPIKVNFPGSSLNTGDYQVVSILSDTQAIFSGDFVDESNLQYRVIGSFTPGISPSGNDRFPYFYDGCNITQVQEVTPDTAPVKASNEFYLARVQRTGSTVTVQDKRTELLSVAKEDTGWTEATLNSGFTNVSGQEVEYRKNYLGEIEIRGSFTSTVTSGTIFTLPEGFRPPYKSMGLYSYDDESGVKIIAVEDSGVVRSGVGAGNNFDTGQANTIISIRLKTV